MIKLQRNSRIKEARTKRAMNRKRVKSLRKKGMKRRNQEQEVMIHRRRRRVSLEKDQVLQLSHCN